MDSVYKCSRIIRLNSGNSEFAWNLGTRFDESINESFPDRRDGKHQWKEKDLAGKFEFGDVSIDYSGAACWINGVSSFLDFTF